MPLVVKSRGIRSLWNYTVSEIAVQLGVHRNTVRGWMKDGLAVATERRPFLVRGCDLRAFLDQRRAKRKQPLSDGEIYCVACRGPKRPAGNMADLAPKTSTYGTLLGLCPDCGRVIRRVVSRRKLERVASDLEVCIASATETLRTEWGLSLNRDFDTQGER